MLDATIAGLEALDAVGGRRRSAPRSRRPPSTVGLVNAEGQPQLSKAQGPVRVATTGRSVGPPLFESLEALGQERTARPAAGGQSAAVSALATLARRAGARRRRRRAGAGDRSHVGGPDRALRRPGRAAVRRRSRSCRCTGRSRHDGARAADAIIVLGAAQYDGRPVARAAGPPRPRPRALRAGPRADRIVLTGGRQEGDRFTEATAGYNYLRDQGVPDEALLKEVDGHSTWESLAASARFLIARGPHEGRARHRRLPRLPGGGDRRGPRPRRHRVAQRVAPARTPRSCGSSPGRRPPSPSGASSATTGSCGSTTPSTTEPVAGVGVRLREAVR